MYMKELLKRPRNSYNRIILPTDKSAADKSCGVERAWVEQKLKECELFMLFPALVCLIKANHKEISGVFFLGPPEVLAFIWSWQTEHEGALTARV